MYGEDPADQSGIVDFWNYLAGTGATTTCLLFGMAMVSAERWLLYAFGMTVLCCLTAYALSAPGGGFFGDLIACMDSSDPTKWGWMTVSVVLQIFYFEWNVHCILTPLVHTMRPLEEERPHVEGEFAMAEDLNCLFLIKRE